jgi:hypothetical protein
MSPKFIVYVALISLATQLAVEKYRATHGSK